MDDQTKYISLILSADTINEHCLFTIKQARTTSHALATLIALQAFIVATTQTCDQQTPAYETIKAVLEKHTTKLRVLLLNEQSVTLAESLLQQDIVSITRIHGNISRNGFWQVLQQCSSTLQDEKLIKAREWINNWHTQAKSRALAASGYPDALDFIKSGVSPQEYAAMNELNNFMNQVLAGASENEFPAD